MSLRKLLVFSLMIALLSSVGALLTGWPRGFRPTMVDSVYLLTLFFSYFMFFLTPLLVLRWISPEPHRFRILVFLFSALWVLYFGVDSLQFKIFRSHFTYFVAMNTYEGFKAGEVGDMKISKALVMQILLIAGFFYGLIVVTFRKIETGDSSLDAQASTHKAAKAAFIFAFLFLWTPIATQRTWIKRFGWSRLLENHLSAFDQFNLKSFYPQPSDPRHFSFLTETKLYKELEDRAARIPQTVRAEDKPNILFLHLESLRWDALTENNMPLLWKRLKACQRAGTCLRSDSHYSSGNNTPSGIFGILSGLNSFYYYPFRTHLQAPPALELFEKMGYKRSVWLSTNLDYDDLRKFIFSGFRVTDRQSDDGHNALHLNYQTEITEKMLTDLSRGGREPRLDYLQSYLTHFNYYFGDECAVHEPYVRLPFQIDSRNFHHMENEFPLLKNRYLNGVCETDRMIEHVFQRLESLHRLKNTIVVVFGDHGEEFGEHGRFGHSYGLNDEQIRTVFAIFFPKPVPQSLYSLSSHSDVMPTLFDYMKVDSALVDRITNGKSLLRFDPKRDFAVIGTGVTGKTMPNRFAAVSADYKAVFESESAIDADDAEVFDRRDSLLVDYDRNRIQKLLESAESSKQISH